MGAAHAEELPVLSVSPLAGWLTLRSASLSSRLEPGGDTASVRHVRSNMLTNPARGAGAGGGAAARPAAAARPNRRRSRSDLLPEGAASSGGG